jgi:hypothetical protein
VIVMSDVLIRGVAEEDLRRIDADAERRVIGTEADAVTVDFRSATVRITSPYNKMARL